MQKAAFTYADKTAVIDNWNKKISYSELLKFTDTVAARLRAVYQVRKGDHVAVMLYNSLEFCVAFLALNKLGAVTVPLPTKYKQPEVVSLTEKAAVNLVLCDCDFYDWFAGFEQKGIRRICVHCSEQEYGFAGWGPGQTTDLPGEGMPEDPAILMFTSGTTSFSKGALLCNYNIMHAVAAYQKIFRITPEDRTVIAIPIYHITGITALLGLFLYAGGTVWLHKQFDASRVLKCVHEEQLTFLHASPTVFFLLLGKRDSFPSLPSLRSLACGSSNMPVAAIRKLRTWLPDADFHTVYGLTETSSPATIFPGNASESPYIGSSGLPIPGLELKITNDCGEEVPDGEIGEILLRGTVILECYFRLETDAITAEGWFKTGDLGYVNPEGYLYVVDRKKDMINRGGEKICSFDVENELHMLSGIEEAAVVGIADEKYGEVPAAAIKPEKGSSLSAQEIRSLLKSRLASYQIPSQYLFLSEIPKTPNGKTDKREIRKLFIQAKENSTC